MSNVRISHDMTASRIGAWGSHRGMAGAEREFWAQKIAKRRLDGPFGDQNDQIQDVYDETWWNKYDLEVSLYHASHSDDLKMLQTSKKPPSRVVKLQITRHLSRNKKK